MVTIFRELPNGIVQEHPPQPIHPPSPIHPPTPIHDLFPPGAYRGWLRATDVSSSAFLVPTTTGGGGNGT
jgi:hypothetical protein